MRKLVKREKMLLGILLLLLAVVAYGWFFYQPVMQRLSDARQRLAAAEDGLAVDQARLAQLRQMEQALYEMRLSPDFRSSLMPKYDNIKLVMVELDGILFAARDYGLTFGQPRFDKRMAQRAVELNFNADSYTAAKDILSALYVFPYRCNLQDITIQPLENTPQADIAAQPVSVRLTMTLYEKL